MTCPFLESSSRFFRSHNKRIKAVTVVIMESLLLSISLLSFLNISMVYSDALKTLTLRPNYTQVDGWMTHPLTYDNYECVDETSANGDTDYVYTGYDDRQEKYRFEDHTSEQGTISNVRVIITAKLVVGVGELDDDQIIIQCGGYDGATVDLSTNYGQRSSDWATNPTTGNTWQWGEIDALTAGFKTKKVDILPNFWRVTQIYVEVTYTSTRDEYAILVAPLRESDPQSQRNEFKHDIHQMRLVLLDCGWTDDNIIFLTRSDICKQEVNEPWIDGDATRENVGKALDAIASGGTYRFKQTDGVLGPEQTFQASDINDIVFVEFRDHGGRRSDSHSDEADNKEGILGTYEWNDRNWNSAYYWDDTEIATKVDSITCYELIFIDSSCHSGEFVDDCQTTGRIIISSCDDHEFAYTCQYKFYSAITNSNADTDQNGKISVEEAHNYATSQVTIQDQNPQMADGISGEVYLDP